MSPVEHVVQHLLDLELAARLANFCWDSADREFGGDEPFLIEEHRLLEGLFQVERRAVYENNFNAPW